jgi:hypothetical protein
MGWRNFLEVDADGATGPLATRPAGTVPAWNGMALRTAGAAQVLHTVALLHTCMYNAWAAYDGAARQTALGVAVRLPRTARDAASRTAALNHAAHGVLAGLFPETHAGLDPAAAADPFSPAGIGRTQAAAMLGVRHRDQPFALMPAEVRLPVLADQQAIAAHWFGLARDLSVRHGHDDDRDVLLYFVLANALADAALAAVDGGAAAAAALRRFTGGSLLDAAASEAGRKVGARVFDKARRHWQGKG